ncbi:MAG: ATP-binding protein [Candidatus Wallbacteria bacterium]|nr:ATP-binding protein [Candidatus Wallbacteria bacterium]
MSDLFYRNYSIINKLHGIFVESLNIQTVLSYLRDNIAPELGIRRFGIVGGEAAVERKKFIFSFNLDSQLLERITAQNLERLREWLQGKDECYVEFEKKFFFVFQEEGERELIFFEPLHLKDKYFGMMIISSEFSHSSPDDHLMLILIANQISEFFYLSKVIRRHRKLYSFNRKILSEMSNGVVVSNSEGIILYANRRAEEFLGSSGMEGCNIENFFSSVELKILSDNPGRTFEIKNGGRHLGLSQSNFNLVSDTGGIILIKDITEIMELKEKLWQSQRLRELGEISQHIAHEIRNPLQVIQGFTQLFLEDPALSPEKKEFARLVVNESQHLSSLLENLLDYTRPLQIVWKNIKLSEFINELTLPYLPKLKSQNVVLKIEIPETTVVATDPGKLKELILNIFWNSLDALEESTKSDRLLNFSAISDESGWELRIENNGPLIPDSEVEKLFQPFYTTKQRGSGLGLSIVKKFCDALGGIVKVQSDEQNTGFIFRFPKKEEAVATA